MRIWVLERIEEADFDQFEGFVVKATSEDDARRCVAERIRGDPNANFDDPGTWLDSSETSCLEVEDEGSESTIVLEAFHYG